MTGPVRVQLKRAKGWRLPPNTLSVARPGRWGNPFRVDLLGRERALGMFRDALQGFFSPHIVGDLSDSDFNAMYEAKERWRKRLGYDHPASALYELRGKNLACWCPLDAPCHADVLLELANQ